MMSESASVYSSSCNAPHCQVGRLQIEEKPTERISCLRRERDGLVVTVRVSWEELERGAAMALEAVDQSEPWGES